MYLPGHEQLIHPRSFIETHAGSHLLKSNEGHPPAPGTPPLFGLDGVVERLTMIGQKKCCKHTFWNAVPLCWKLEVYFCFMSLSLLQLVRNCEAFILVTERPVFEVLVTYSVVSSHKWDIHVCRSFYTHHHSRLLYREGTWRHIHRYLYKYFIKRLTKGRQKFKRYLLSN